MLKGLCHGLNLRASVLNQDSSVFQDRLRSVRVVRAKQVSPEEGDRSEPANLRVLCRGWRSQEFSDIPLRLLPVVGQADGFSDPLHCVQVLLQPLLT